MATLSKSIRSRQSAPQPWQPTILDLTSDVDRSTFKQLLEKPEISVIDTYETQVEELLVLNSPRLYSDKKARAIELIRHLRDHYQNQDPSYAGKWIYYPWRGSILHVLDDADYQRVRTGRNRNLITPEEQEQYYHATVGIAGLSVGNSIALSIVQTGGAKNIKLADPDILELTNLNRIRSGIHELTEPKVYLTARQIYELDPYANITLYTEGITDDTIDDFFKDLDIVIDEIDSLAIKIKLRDRARQQQIPLVSAVDNGDSGIVDIERHDLDDNIPYFHGRAGDDIAEVVQQNLPQPAIGKIIGEKLVGYDVTEPRMQQSLLDIGDSIPTWPQLGGAALLNGVATAAIVRKIITGQPVESNRAMISMPHMIVPGYDSEEQVTERAEGTRQFAQAFNDKIERIIEKISSSAKNPKN